MPLEINAAPILSSGRFHNVARTVGETSGSIGYVEYIYRS